MLYTKKVNKEIKSIIVTPCFIYEVMIYKREGNIYSIQDSKVFKSETYFEDKVNAPKNSNKFIYTDLIGAPINWLINNGYEETDPQELLKKKFRKK